MSSLITIQCPHCGAKGQVTPPPEGSVVVGPCMSCEAPIAIFWGFALPLEREIMETEDEEAKQRHVLNVLSEFLRERLTGSLRSVQAKREEEAETAPEEQSEFGARPITKQERDVFVSDLLPQIDDPAYFHSVFG